MAVIASWYTVLCSVVAAGRKHANSAKHTQPATVSLQQAVHCDVQSSRLLAPAQQEGLCQGWQQVTAGLSSHSVPHGPHPIWVVMHFCS